MLTEEKCLKIKLTIHLATSQQPQHKQRSENIEGGEKKREDILLPGGIEMLQLPVTGICFSSYKSIKPTLACYGKTCQVKVNVE